MKTTELNLSASELVQQVPLSKQGIQAFARTVIEDVEEGRINPLRLKLYIKAMEATIAYIQKGDAAMPGIDEAVRNEAEKHGKSFEMAGVKVELAEVGTKYDYSDCGDTVYERMQAELTALQEKIKQRETLLKAITDPISMNDEKTGEVLTVRAPLKSSTSSVKITFK